MNEEATKLSKTDEAMLVQYGVDVISTEELVAELEAEHEAMQNH